MVEQHSEAIEMDVDETSESTTAAADSMITDRKRMPLILPYEQAGACIPTRCNDTMVERQRGRKVPDPSGGTGGRGPQSEVRSGSDPEMLRASKLSPLRPQLRTYRGIAASIRIGPQ
jgi:hypothetical protein